MRASVSIAIFITLAPACGCYQAIERRVIHDEIVQSRDQVILMALLRDGSSVDYNDSGATYLVKEREGREALYVSGTTRDGAVRTIEVAEIEAARIRSREFNTIASTVVLATGVLAALFVAAFSSAIN